MSDELSYGKKIVLVALYLLLIAIFTLMFMFLKSNNKEDITCDSFYDYITLNNTTNIEKGSKEYLFNSLYDVDECHKDLEIITSNNSIKYEDNKIIALESGESTLTIKINDIERTYKFNVIEEISKDPVYINPDVSIKNITLSQETATLKKGSNLILEAKITPQNVINKNLVWISSNNSVATVQNGEVKAVGTGSATITVRSNNDIIAKCEINVYDKTPTQTIEVESVTLSHKNITMNENTTLTLNYTVEPSNATNRKITWTSSDESIATVSNGVINALKAGQTVITAKSSNGKTAKLIVTVLKTEETQKPKEEIKEDILTYKYECNTYGYRDNNGKIINTINDTKSEPYIYYYKMGSFSTGGYNVNITNVDVDSKNNVVVSVKETYPDLSGSVTSVLTYPTCKIEFNKKPTSYKVVKEEIKPTKPSVQEPTKEKITYTYSCNTYGDFKDKDDNKVVYYIKMGTFNTGGYSIDVTSIDIDDSNNVVVNVIKSYPDRNGIVTQAFTSPTCRVVFSDKPTTYKVLNSDGSTHTNPTK